MIQCEIFAPSSESGDELCCIAKSCAIDLKLAFPLTIDKRFARSNAETRINLAIPLEIALLYEAAWKLASRIACFCPQARVSAQILGTQSP